MTTMQYHTGKHIDIFEKRNAVYKQMEQSFLSRKYQAHRVFR